MITEEAVPLQVSLEDDSGKSDYAISWGIHQILVSRYCVCACVNIFVSSVCNTLVLVIFRKPFRFSTMIVGWFTGISVSHLCLWTLQGSGN